VQASNDSRLRSAGAKGLCLLVLAALLVQGAPAAASGPVQGGSLTVGIEEEFNGFDPIKARFLGAMDRHVAMAVEERLFDLDEKGNLVPELALSASTSPDGRVWTIKLRQGVAFHDGTPFNADAVVAHWQRLLDPKNRYIGLSALEPIESVTKADEHTVRFALKRPWFLFRNQITGSGFASLIPSPKAVQEGTQNRAPVGTGAFMFKEWVSNDRLVLVRNPGYWRKGKPHLDTVAFRPMPDMQARFAALQSGQADAILTDRGAHILQAGEDRSLRVYSGDYSGPYSFLFNMSKPPLDDPRARRALAHAWNQEFLVKANFRGTVPVVSDPFGGSPACGDSGYRKHDVAKAKELLAEYGQPVTLELTHTNTPRGKEAGEITQRLFKEVGVTLTLTPLAPGEVFRRLMGGEFQISSWRIPDYPDMGPYLHESVGSKGRMNLGRYASHAMDEHLMVQATSNDAEARKKALCSVARLINEDAVFLYLGGRRFHILARADLQGVTAGHHSVVKVADIWRDGGAAK